MVAIYFLVGIILGFGLQILLIEKTGDTIFGHIMDFLYGLKKK